MFPHDETPLFAAITHGTETFDVQWSKLRDSQFFTDQEWTYHVEIVFGMTKPNWLVASFLIFSAVSSEFKFLLTLAELGTQQFCPDNVTMLSGHKVVSNCHLTIFIVATPSRHWGFTIFWFFSGPWSYITLSRCRNCEALHFRSQNVIKVRETQRYKYERRLVHAVFVVNKKRQK